MDSPILSPAEMKAAEEAAFARGIKVEALMDEAGAGIATSIRKFFPNPQRCLVFVGKGHNGGDALVAAHALKLAGWEVEIHLVFPGYENSELTGKKLQVFRNVAPTPSLKSRPALHTILLDGVLGLGAKPPLREPVRAACCKINSLRHEQKAFVFAADIPTGLDGETGETDPDCVIADCTIAVGFAKTGLVADHATNFVGRLEIVELRQLTGDELPLAQGRAEARPSEVVATSTSLRGLLSARNFDAYKNQFGRIGIVAGAKGYTGAATMCSLGALRGGAGLVEVFVPKEIYPIVAAAAAPEAMVKPIGSYRSLRDREIDVWAVGPGLGKAHAEEVLELIARAEKPMVVDADGLNIVSDNPETLLRCAGPRLLTPHPGEMKRLFASDRLSRAETVAKFCEKYPVTLLLKGSRSIVGERNRAASFNTTGNPGMATGGMGDVLTGVCAALIGQQLAPYDAARLGAWLCGRAAEIAITSGNASEESLLPRDVLDHLGSAFHDLRETIG